MFAQLRDKVTSVTGWAVYDTNNAGTAAFTGGDYVVFSTPTGEYIRLLATNSGEAELQYGTNWDDAAGNWADRYPQSYPVYPKSEGNYNSMSLTDQVRWYVEYVQGGFAVAVTREQGDGNDSGCMFGVAEITPLWDYTTAQVREGKYSLLALGSYDSHYNTRNVVNHTAEGGGSGGTYHGKGEVNADGNNDNYPMVETTLQASSKYEDALIGEHQLWIRDNSGDRTAHLDTVTEGGTDLYQIFKEGLPSAVGLRMD